MKRKAWLIPFLVLFSVSSLIATTTDRMLAPEYNHKTQVKAEKLISPMTEINPERVSHLVPNRDDIQQVAVGEDMVIGYTWYDYQHNGSIGKMIARDGLDGIHFVWMCGYNAQNDPRHMLYNFYDIEAGELSNDPEERQVLDSGDRSGYGSVDLLPEDQRAIPIYHVLGHVENDPEYVGTAISVDFMYALGAFMPFYPPSWPRINLIWPHGALDLNNNAHIMSTEYTGEGNDQIWQRVGYWRGEPSRGFDQWEWTEPPINVDTAGVISAVAATSKQSNRVALGWHHNRIGTDMQTEVGDWDQARGAWQKNNDIVYLVSDDGEDWDWENRQSITKIIPVRPEFAEDDMTEAVGDTFRPYTDLDLQFDPWEGEDNLYAVFAACGFWEKPVPDGDPIPVTGVTGEHGHLWFWNSVEDTITLVYDGWYFNRTDNGGWHSRVGAWRMNADRGSIAFDPENPGKIYIVWVNFPMIMHVVGEGDESHFEYLDNGLAQDTSEAGYKNAEIMVSVSHDRGITWLEPVNITETIWEEDEAPEPGECLSENWSSVAYTADGALHILYILDTDAGGLPQAEGVATNNPVIYHTVPLEDIPDNDPIEMPRPGFMFHNLLDFRPQVSNAMRDPGVPVVGEPVNVVANIIAGGDHDLVDVILEYSIDGEVSEVAMEATGEPDQFGAQIPAQEDETNVWYRIIAVNDADLTTVVPNNYWFSYTVRPEGGLLIRDVQWLPAEWGVDYSPYKGYMVTVTGIVTTPASFNQEYGAYAIQEDVEESWSGVFVRGIDDDLEVGTQIRVSGMVMEKDPDDPVKWEYETYIDAEAYQPVGVGWINAILVDVADISFPQVRVEEFEGVLIYLTDTEVDTIAPGDSRYLPITDVQAGSEGWFTTLGLTQQIKDELGIDGYRQGTFFQELEGVFVENYGKYAIAPRTAADFIGVGVNEDRELSPYRFILAPAYPNPFNAVTHIGFELPRDSWANLSVYDLSGRIVSLIVEGEMRAGHYEFTVDASALTSGVYIMQLQTESQTANQKLVLVK